MKATILFYLIFTMSITVFAQEKSISLEGAWQVVSWQQVSGDSLIWSLPGNISGNQIKIWSKNHFLFVGYFQTDSSKGDDYGGGTYKLNGNQYEENILYFADKSAIGSIVRLLLETRNDTLIQIWPVDENWQVIKSKYNVQKFTRIE